MFREFLKFLLWVGGAVGIVVAILRIWFVDIVVVGDDGMMPTIFPGDTVAIWRRSTPGLGDVTLCENPSAPGIHTVSRVLAMPGDTVEILGDQSAARSGVQVASAHSQPPRFAINRHPVDYDSNGTRSMPDPTTGQAREYAYKREMLGNNPHDIFGDPRGRFWIPETRAENGYYLLGDNRTNHSFDSRSFGVVPIETCHGIVIARVKPGLISANDVPHSWGDLIR